MASKTVALITGANTGIGFETVKALLQSSQSYHIYLGSRSPDKGREAVEQLRKDVPETTSTIETIQVDVESDESIVAAFEAVQKAWGRLDVLVNNAGAALERKLQTGELTLRQVWVRDFDINVAGTQFVTTTFAPLLLKSEAPRLLFVTSGLASFDGLSQSFSPHQPPPGAGWPKPPIPDAYRVSKTALNAAMLLWHWQLRADGVRVWAVSPGFLATDLGGDREMLLRSGAGHPSSGGRLITSIVEGQRDADVGKVVNNDGVQPF